MLRFCKDQNVGKIQEKVGKKTEVFGKLKNCIYA